MHRLLSILFLALIAASAHAMAIDLHALPADRQWLVHLDVAALRDGEIGHWLHAQLRRPEVRKQYNLDTLESLLGGDPIDLIDDATMSGSSPDGSSVVCALRGRFDAKLVNTLVPLATDHSEEQHGAYVIHRWRDAQKNTPAAGCLARDGLLLFSEKPEAIFAALDALDGKTGSLRADSPLVIAAGGAGSAPSLLTAAATGVDAWPGQPGTAAMLKEVRALSFTLAERGRSLACDLRLVATTADAGDRIANLAKGLIALAQFNPDVQKDAVLATVLRETAVTREGASVTGTVSYPLQALLASLEARFGAAAGAGAK